MDTILPDHTKKQAIIYFRKTYKRYLNKTEIEFRLLYNNRKYDHQGLQTQKAKLINELIATLEKIIRQARGDMQNKIRIANTIGEQAVNYTIIATIIAMAMALLIAFLNARTINHPVVTLMKGTRQIAQGEFNSPLNISSPPEIKALAESFNIMCARLQELDRMKSDFIAHVSHELRTPLHGMVGIAETLASGANGAIPASQKYQLDIIIKSGQRLANLVDDLLDYHKMRYGSMDIQKSAVSLGSATRLVLELSSHLLKVWLAVVKSLATFSAIKEALVFCEIFSGCLP